MNASSAPCSSTLSLQRSFSLAFARTPAQYKRKQRDAHAWYSDRNADGSSLPSDDTHPHTSYRVWFQARKIPEGKAAAGFARAVSLVKSGKCTSVRYTPPPVSHSLTSISSSVSGSVPPHVWFMPALSCQ